MIWLREVTHVAWKDVRQQRWLVLAYLGLVAIATWRALRLTSGRPLNNGWEVLSVLVVVFGAILAASFIQTDSPTQSDAFWVSHPFRSSAVFAAKLLLVATVVIGAPLLGQILGMAGFHVAANQWPALLAACLTALSMWLLIALLVGGLTRDLRSFIIACLLTAIAAGLLSGVVIDREKGFLERPGLQVALMIFAFAGSLATLGLLYTRRNWRRAGWLASGLTCAAALLSAFSSASSPSPTPTLAGSDVGPLTLSFDPRAIAEDDRLVLTIAAPRAPQDRLVEFAVDTVDVHLQGGGTIEMSPHREPVVIHPADLPVRQGVRWLEHAGETNTDRALSVELNHEQRRAIAGGISGIDVRGRVIALSPHLDGSLALAPGSEFDNPGRRTMLVRADGTVGHVKFLVRTVALRESDKFDMDFSYRRRHTFALVNEDRGEATPLVQGMSGMNSEFLVLPGTSVTTGTFEAMSPKTAPGGATVAVDEHWMQNAQLIVGRWIIDATYPASVHTTALEIHQ